MSQVPGPSDSPTVSMSPAPQASARPPAAVLSVDSEGIQPVYTNFARVTNLPEELVLDFGLNTATGAGEGRIRVSQCLAMNYFTAKRLWAALGLAIQKHEQAFGVIETDINKRLSPRGAGAAR